MLAENRADLGQPSVAVGGEVKGSLPRRLSREDERALSFQHFALPAPQVAQGVMPVNSRSTTTSGSSSCRGAEDVNWDEMLTASRASQPDTLCGSQRSARSQPAPSPASRHRWEPQLGSPILPRPVLSTVSTRPLRRPSSAAALDKGRLDELLAQAEAVKDEAKMLKRHRRSEVEPDLKQLVEMFPKFTDTRLKPLSEIFERTNSIRAAREEKLAAETTAQLEAKLQEAVTFWDVHPVHPGRQRKCGVAGAMSPISEKTERTDKATPKSATPKREASLPALLSWSEGLEASEVKDLDLPEEMLAPPEASPQRSGHDEEVHLHLEEVPHPKGVPKEDVKPCSFAPEHDIATTTPKTPQDEINPSDKTAVSDTPEEPPSPTLKGLLQSMEKDEHFTWLASLGPVRPLTLKETLQDMAMTIASVDAQLLSAHPPSQLEANAQLQQASNRAAEASPPTAASLSDTGPAMGSMGSQESTELHQEEEPREPRAPAATPKSAEIAGELLRKKVKSPILSDTPDTASVISRGSKKEIEEALSQGVGTPDSSTLARFLNRRSPAPSTAGTPRPNLGRQAQGSRSRVSSEESNAFSDVSFFGQSSICEPHGTVAAFARGGRGPSAPAAPASRKGHTPAVSPTAHAAAATPKAMVECALCGRRKGCQPGSCFCIDCSQRMNQINPASPSSADESPAGAPPVSSSRGTRRGKAAACVICSQPLPGDGSDGSVLCPSCLKGQR